MKRKLVLILLTLFVLGCTESIGKELGVIERESLKYHKGINKGIEICESNYIPRLEQFDPINETCIVIIWDNYTMRHVCESDDNTEMEKVVLKELARLTEYKKLNLSDYRKPNMPNKILNLSGK